MPYTYKKEGNKYCVYNKNTGKKVGCTTKSIKQYLSALHANVPDSTTEELKEGIKSIIRSMLKEEEQAIMRSKVENDSIENVLNRNVGIPFDQKEKQEVIFKQGEMGLKSTIQRNGTEIKFSTSDMFGNNKLNIIKKLKNMSDPNTLVYASFFTVSNSGDEQEKPQAGQQSAQPKPEEKKTHMKLSQPFEDKGSEKLDILGDFIQQLDIK
jgi:hypothetical protein